MPNSRKGSSNGSIKGVDRREALREKNRNAAAKCRLKKRESEAILEARYRAVVAGNQGMKHQLRELRDQLTFCRTLALEHMHADRGCQCKDLQQYNMNQAHMTAINVQCQAAYNSRPQLQLEDSSERHGLPQNTSTSDNLAGSREGLHP